MPKIRETLLLAHHFKFLSNDEFVLLYDLNKPKNPEIPRGGQRIDIDDLHCAMMNAKRTSGFSETTSIV